MRIITELTSRFHQNYSKNPKKHWSRFSCGGCFQFDQHNSLLIIDTYCTKLSGHGQMFILGQHNMNIYANTIVYYWWWNFHDALAAVTSRCSEAYLFPLRPMNINSWKGNPHVSYTYTEHSKLLWSWSVFEDSALEFNIFSKSFRFVFDQRRRRRRRPHIRVSSMNTPTLASPWFAKSIFLHSLVAVLSRPGHWTWGNL